MSYLRYLYPRSNSRALDCASQNAESLGSFPRQENESHWTSQERLKCLFKLPSEVCLLARYYAYYPFTPLLAPNSIRFGSEAFLQSGLSIPWTAPRKAGIFPVVPGLLEDKGLGCGRVWMRQEYPSRCWSRSNSSGTTLAGQTRGVVAARRPGSGSSANRTR